MKDITDLYDQQTDIAVYTPLDSLISEYQSNKAAIEKISSYIADNKSAIMHYFFEGARVKKNTGVFSASTFFDQSNAIGALDAEYWSRTIKMTDVLDAMPAKLRNEWNEQINTHQTPPFERDTVRATLNDLLNKRQIFFAERVDGIFKSLSGEHVTNQPQAFSKRLIIGWLGTNETWGFNMNHQTVEYIHDLRVVIGKFMGRVIPRSNDTYQIIKRMYDNQQTGVWHEFDGRAWRLKVFKKGTAHIEIHPDMAWRLNKVLASLYPKAIPPDVRKKPQKQTKTPPIVETLLPEVVLRDLADARVYEHTDLGFYKEIDPETKNVLCMLEGRQVVKSRWAFDYPIEEVVNEILRTGTIPEKKSHQFYQTPESLAEYVVDLAEIDEAHQVLEPSAGFGAIATKLPKENTLCIDINSLHCKILQKKGYKTLHQDFLTAELPHSFDRIVLNPPYTKGQALQHLKKAHSVLKEGGKLVAILPASMKDKEFFDDSDHIWSDILEKQFIESGTGVNVALLELIKSGGERHVNG